MGHTYTHSQSTDILKTKDITTTTHNSQYLLGVIISHSSFQFTFNLVSNSNLLFKGYYFFKYMFGFYFGIDKSMLEIKKLILIFLFIKSKIDFDIKNRIYLKMSEGAG